MATDIRSAIEVVRSSEATPKPLSSMLPYQRGPYASSQALAIHNGIPIVTPDVEEGRQRTLADTEGIEVGKMVIGPNGGENWHTHLSFYDFVFYILSGKARVSWKADGEEHVAHLEKGDYLLIRAGAEHEWTNAGDNDLEIISFGHFYNPQDAARLPISDPQLERA